MMAFTIKINKRALNDIKKALDYYDAIDTAVGDKFETTINKTINLILTNPFFKLDMPMCVVY